MARHKADYKAATHWQQQPPDRKFFCLSSYHWCAAVETSQGLIEALT
jgi:hypothetical protein